MKKYLTCFVLFISVICSGQSGKWTISLDYGLQAHDKRLFNFPPFPASELLERQPETFGTHQFGISLKREIAKKRKMNFQIGVGLSIELATFERPFDSDYGKRYKLEVLRFTDRYCNYLIQLPLSTRYKVNNNIALSMELLSQFNILTVAGHTKGGKNYSWWRPDLFSVELNPGLEYTKKRFILKLNYRAFQVKKIDRILFNNILDDPRREQTFETFNPFKMWLSIGYMF